MELLMPLLGWCSVLWGCSVRACALVRHCIWDQVGPGKQYAGFKKWMQIAVIVTTMLCCLTVRQWMVCTHLYALLSEKLGVAGASCKGWCFSSGSAGLNIVMQMEPLCFPEPCSGGCVPVVRAEVWYSIWIVLWFPVFYWRVGMNMSAI